MSSDDSAVDLMEMGGGFEDAIHSQVEGPQSLVELFEPREWPGRIGLWRVALQVPEPPEYSPGGIAMPEQYREDKEFATYIGNVRAMGALCFKSRTNGGVELSEDPAFGIGDWVMVDRGAGRKFKTVDGTLWIVISETQYISVIYQPEQFDCMRL